MKLATAILQTLRAQCLPALFSSINNWILNLFWLRKIKAIHWRKKSGSLITSSFLSRSVEKRLLRKLPILSKICLLCLLFWSFIQILESTQCNAFWHFGLTSVPFPTVMLAPQMSSKFARLFEDLAFGFPDTETTTKPKIFKNVFIYVLSANFYFAYECRLWFNLCLWLTMRRAGLVGR